MSKIFFNKSLILVLTSFLLVSRFETVKCEIEGISQSLRLPYCKEIWKKKIIPLVEYQDWIVEVSNGIMASMAYGSDIAGEHDAIQVIYKSQTRDVSKPQIVLRSAGLSSQKFKVINAVSLALKGNQDGYARVVFKDAKGSAFFSKKAVSLKYDAWDQSRSSLAKDSIVYHGKNAGKMSGFVPEAPYSIDHIRLSLSKGKSKREAVKLFNIKLWVDPSTTEREELTSPYDQWLQSVCNIRSQGNENVKLVLPVLANPLTIGSSVPIRIKGYSHEGRIDVCIKRFGSGHECERSDRLKNQNGDMTSIELVHKFESSGMYAVTASIVNSNGDISARTSQSIMAWDPPGNVYQDNEPAFFGMMYLDRFSDTREYDLKIMADAGVKVVRFPYRWSEIQVKKNKYVWHTYDAFMRDINRNNFIAQPMLFYTPDWAGRDLKNSRYEILANKKQQWVVPDSTESVTEFILESAKRYGKQPVVWELYNEPTESQHWVGGDVEDYLAILRSLRNKLKQARISINLITAGIGVVDAQDQNFPLVLARNIEGLADGYSVHSYGGDKNAIQNIALASSMLSGSVQGVGIWLNETGYLVDPHDPAGELRRASVLARTAVVSRFMRVKNFNWFIFRNFSASAKSAEDNFAVISEDGSIRPPILAYANVARLLANSVPVKELQLEPGVSAYEFNMKDKKMLVAWVDDEDREVQISLILREGWKLAEVYDVFGGRVKYLEEINNNIMQSHSPLFFIYERDA